MVARSINEVKLLGRLGQDPELRYASSGLAIANMSMATSQGRKDQKTGEYTENTEWHKIVAWGDLGELCAYLKKGDLILVVGMLKTNKWDKNGVTQYQVQIHANTVVKCELLKGDTPADHKPTDDGRTARSGGLEYPETAGGNSTVDDDIPF